jgi:hypothetical protein
MFIVEPLLFHRSPTNGRLLLLVAEKFKKKKITNVQSVSQYQVFVVVVGRPNTSFRMPHTTYFVPNCFTDQKIRPARWDTWQNFKPFVSEIVAVFNEFLKQTVKGWIFHFFISSSLKITSKGIPWKIRQTVWKYKPDGARYTGVAYAKVNWTRAGVKGAPEQTPEQQA